MLPAFWIYFDGWKPFSVIRGSLMVENRIPDHADANLLGSPGKLQKLFLGTPLRCSASLLIEFAQVI